YWSHVRACRLVLMRRSWPVSVLHFCPEKRLLQGFLYLPEKTTIMAINRKRVFVTGAASGIGRSVALRFAEEGFDVCLNDVQADKLRDVYNELPRAGHIILPGSYTDVLTLREGEVLIKKWWGELDVLVNCAGISERTDPVKMDIRRWR